MITESNGAIFQILDQFGFKGIAFVHGKCIRFGNRPHLKLRFLTGILEHGFLQFGKVTFTKVMTIKIYIIVKTIVDRRPDGKLNAWI